MAEFVTALSRFPVGHLVDLGAGHGIFARMAADLGWRVTAVDARDVRFPDDPRVRWVTADVRGFDEYDGVTVVACLGLWYHLTLADQLALVAKIAPLPIILDTHVARPDLGDHPVHATKLSGIVSEGAYSGRLYSESGKAAQATASWGNTRSFWPTPESLERQLNQAGYDVMERLLPPVAPDRDYVVARTLDGERRQQLDGLIARYNPLRPEGEAAGVAEMPATSHPAPFSVRRVVSALRRRTGRG
jgi:hypothetical protein